MAVLNQALADGANFVARAVEYQIRQATTTALSSPTPSPTQPPSTSSTLLPTSSPTSSDPQPSPTNNPSDNDGNNGNSGTNSPLLFFVALGFGVVFTNLWIIVGVKYCFRYNARNRQLRGVDENGEPINLENMPTRPHRRRREKKLMTMDEVNEKFPMMKYKTWVSERARDGLPTTGGVSAPPSRANSVRSVEGIVPDLPSKERESIEERPATSSAPKLADKDDPKPNTENPDGVSGGNTTNDSTNDTTATQGTPTQLATDTTTKGDILRASMYEDDDDDDEHINAALPPELMGTAGDTCAICIDTLEDDDDIRGLTCGHAFHAVCLDPWLTNRRACCPLCKADYYTPKPRPPPADGDPNNPTSPTAADPSRNNGRMNMPRAPQRTLTSWSNFREAPRLMFPGRFGGNAGGGPGNQGQQQRRWQRQRPERSGRRDAVSQPVAPTREENENGTWISRFRGQFPPRLNQMMRRNREGQPAAATTEVTAFGANGSGAAPAATTPSQLEAGVRPSTTTAAH